jgi:hypothetical protein
MDTFPCNVVLPGYTEVKTITYEELERKYDVVFDTIIADCEGALYYILADNPNILDNIKLMIMENDYRDINQKKLVDAILTYKGLTRCYYQCGGWHPCFDNFYEVWKK